MSGGKSGGGRGSGGKTVASIPQSGERAARNISGVLGNQGVRDGDIKNVGTIEVDKVQPDAIAVGLEINFSGATTKNKISLRDNLVDALNITQAGNSYIKINTANSNGEYVTFGKPIIAGDVKLDAVGAATAGIQLQSPIAREVTAATNANPAQFTSVAHGMANGDPVVLTQFQGNWAVVNRNRSENQGFYYAVDVTADDFKLAVANPPFGVANITVGSPTTITLNRPHQFDTNGGGGDGTPDATGLTVTFSGLTGDFAAWNGVGKAVASIINTGGGFAASQTFTISENSTSYSGGGNQTTGQQALVLFNGLNGQYGDLGAYSGNSDSTKGKIGALKSRLLFCEPTAFAAGGGWAGSPLYIDVTDEKAPSGKATFDAEARFKNGVYNEKTKPGQSSAGLPHNMIGTYDVAVGGYHANSTEWSRQSAGINPQSGGYGFVDIDGRRQASVTFSIPAGHSLNDGSSYTIVCGTRDHTVAGGIPYYTKSAIDNYDSIVVTPSWAVAASNPLSFSTFEEDWEVTCEGVDAETSYLEDGFPNGVANGNQLTDVTRANPAVFEFTGNHGLAVGDYVLLPSFSSNGMTQFDSMTGYTAGKTPLKVVGLGDNANGNAPTVGANPTTKVRLSLNGAIIRTDNGQAPGGGNFSNFSGTLDECSWVTGPGVVFKITNKSGPGDHMLGNSGHKVTFNWIAL